MDIMTHAEFGFNQLMSSLIFGIRASEPPWAKRMTEKVRPDRVKYLQLKDKKTLHYVPVKGQFIGSFSVFIPLNCIIWQLVGS